MTQSFSQISHSEAATQALAAALVEKLRPGDVITLTGDLGAGKTAFTKGIAQFLGVSKEITSPTFAIMNVYDTTNPTIKRLIHIDTYRLKSSAELAGIGVEDFIGAPDTLTIIEWPELAAPWLSGKPIAAVTLVHNEDNTRTITVHQTKTDTI